MAGGVSRCAQCAIGGGRCGGVGGNWSRRCGCGDIGARGPYWVWGARWCWGQVVVIRQPHDDDGIIVVVSAADGAMGPQGGPVCLPSSAKVGWGFTGMPPPSLLSFAVSPCSSPVSSLHPPVFSPPFLSPPSLSTLADVQNRSVDQVLLSREATGRGVVGQEVAEGV